MERVSLIRSIGEHNWEEGKRLLEEQATNFLCVQIFYGTGDLNWNFCVTKEDDVFYRETYKKKNDSDIWILCSKEPFHESL